MTSKRVADLIEQRRFLHPEVRKTLDEMSVVGLTEMLGEPDVRRVYAETDWRPGDGRPALASDDPAVMQAIGRCAAAHVRGRNVPGIQLGLGAIHPDDCGWCEYPQAERLAACRWAVWHSRYVVQEVLVWHNSRHDEYVRPGRADYYEQPQWQAFWTLPVSQRRHRIEQAASR